ncbi:MAG: sigma-70 family RNA polymerase sigma factor, partial [Bryobacteraceae bacterium]
ERIVAFAASRIAGDAAEDLAQETLMLLHDKYAHVTRLEELFPLSMQIMRFKMVAMRRKSYRRGEAGQVSVDDIQIPDLGPDPATFVERKEMMERMTAAIAKLGDRCREIFRLKLLGRSFGEIQVEMKASSINTVYTWDARCRKQLLDEMGGTWERRQ